MLKRLFDLAIASAALIALSPLLIPIALLLRFTGEGEIFYRQQRIGRGGKPFMILKFATMLKDSAALPGGDITIGNDPRILPMGRFLRDTKLNELPQLLNVVMGDMSIIGPRPLTPRVAALFPDGHWTALAALRPGLSGVGSIVFRDEERLLDGAEDRLAVYQAAIVPYKAALELWYARHMGVALDIKLIALTLWAVLRPGFSVADHLPDLPPPPQPLADLRAAAGKRGKPGAPRKQAA